MATLLRIHGRTGDPRAAAVRVELQQLAPEHEALKAPAAPHTIEHEPEEDIGSTVDLDVGPSAGDVQHEQLEDEVVEVDETGVELDAEEEVFESEEVPDAQVAASASPAAAPESAGAAEAIEEEDAFTSDLAEADFYLQAGLSEDARAILEAILMAEPGHRGANRRLAELGGGGARG